MKNFTFYVLMMFKSVAFTYKLTWLAQRYYRTVKKCNTFEIWYCAITLIKIVLICPLYFLRDINLLYFVFVINSLITQVFTHVLRLRACVALNAPKEKVQWNQWMFFL